MKPIKFLPIAMIAVAGLIASCSTSKLAQNNSDDDVYNTVAKARAVEYVAPVPQQQQQAQNDQEYDEYYGTSNPYYDMDYSSRINRFYNGSAFRGYYDPYYDNYYYGNSYGYNNFLGSGLNWRNGYGLGGWGGGFYGGWGYGSIWNNPFYYGNMGWGMNNWGWNNWGPYSYYDRFGWGGGFYGGGFGYGGYYGGGFGNYANGNYRARPNRDGDNRGSYGSTGSRTAPISGNYGRPSVSTNNAGRPERYSNGNNNGSFNNGQAGRVSSRPSRDNSYRPQPQTQQSQPASRPDRGSYSPPAQSSGSSGGGGVSSGGGGGGRPTRGGGR